MTSLLIPMVLFFLAGILVGNLLWYRDPNQDRRRIEAAEDRYLKSRASSRRARTACRAATRRQRDLEALARRYQSRVARLERAVALNQQQCKAELRRSETLVKQLRDVLKSRTEIQRQLSETTDQLAAAARRDEASDGRRGPPTAKTFDSSSADGPRQTLRAELADTARLLRDAEQKLADRETELRSQRHEIETLRSALDSHDTLRDDYEQAVDQLSELIEICDRLRAELKQARSSGSVRSQLQSFIASLQDQVAAHADTITRLRARSEDDVSRPGPVVVSLEIAAVTEDSDRRAA